MKCLYCTSLQHSAICCHLSACSDLSALKCPTADSDFDGLANVVGVGDNAIGGVDLATIS